MSLEDVTGLLLASVLSSLPPAHAQTPELRFQRLGSESGLSHNSVYAITEDAEGFLWIGTADGLNRYDGYEFRVYRYDPQDTASLSNNLIHDLLPDRGGGLWVATAGGLDRLDPAGNRPARYTLKSATEVEARTAFDLFQARDGTLWVGTDAGLFRYEREGDRFVPMSPEAASGPIEQRRVTVVQEDPDGRLWLLAGGGGSPVLLRMVGTSRFERFEVSADWGPVFAFLIDRRGRFWLGAAGPALLDKEGRRILPPSDPSDRPGVSAIYESRHGVVWIGATDGVHRFEPETGRISHHLPDPSRTAFLFNFVRALHEDRSGTLWVGTHGGVYRADPNAKPFRHLAGDPANPRSLSSNAISSVYGDAEALWVGTYGAGLNRVDRRDGAVRRYRHDPSDPTSLRDDVVGSLHRSSDGTLWVGTGAGLCRLDPRTGRFEWVDLPLPPGRTAQPLVPAIAEAPGGRLWLTGPYGLYGLDPASGAARLYRATAEGSGPSGPLTESVLVEDSEAVWIGIGAGRLRSPGRSVAGALDRLDVPTGTFTHYPLLTEDGQELESEGVWDLHQTPDGALWLATGSGLSRFDPQTETFRHYFQRDGLPGSVVYSILEDGAGRLWLGTNAGLSRFDPRAPEGRQFRNFQAEDGIGNSEFNRAAAFATSDGEFFFGGLNGLTSFFPEEIHDNAYVPPVVFTRIETASRRGVRSHNPRGLEHLVLSYRDYSLSFEVAALSFTHPERNGYAHFLEGFDEEWIETGQRRFVRYTNVPPGEYVLRVRGSNNDGVWNEEGVALRLTVTPPFWATWWFRLSIVLLVVAALVAAYRVRVARLLEIERLRLRIAGDLHDDLSSSLTGIALAGEMVQRSADLGSRERQQLARITATARGMVQDLRDIVWLVDPTHDQLDDLVLKMKDLASTLLDGVTYEFRADTRGLPGRLGLGFRRQVFLIYKEILHNIARHAGASSVAIEVVERDRRLTLRVIDDGVGFDPAAERGGFGLRSLRKRAEELDGRIEISSRPGAGTRIELSLPIT